MTKAMSKVSVPLLAAVAVVGYLASAVMASAQVTYTTQLATTTALFAAIGYDLLQTAVVIIGITMGIAVFIFVVFWGWRRLRRAMNG